MWLGALLKVPIEGHARLLRQFFVGRHDCYALSFVYFRGVGLGAPLCRHLVRILYAFVVWVRLSLLHRGWSPARWPCLGLLSARRGCSTAPTRAAFVGMPQGSRQRDTVSIRSVDMQTGPVTAGMSLLLSREQRVVSGSGGGNSACEIDG